MSQVTTLDLSQLTTLRVATAGSVDDGKSTLIGRLLHDTKTVFEDQLQAVERASRRYGDGSVNLALLTDGLRAEREQGITIDVAHRYFATPNRSFIVADTPGHAQYTRNMVTGASTSDVALVLVDARHGVVEQTRRHTFIAALLGLPTIVIAVNKMDLIDWDESAFDRTVKELSELLHGLPDSVRHPQLYAVPISALNGDNVVEASTASPWYDGPALLRLLEQLSATASAGDAGTSSGTVHVQRVIRPHAGVPAKVAVLAGVVSGASLSVGDQVDVVPGGRRSIVRSLTRAGDPVDTALPGHAVVVELDRDVDITRGDALVRVGSAAADANTRPRGTEELTVDVCWMIEQPLRVGMRVWFKHGTRTGRATVAAVAHRYRLDDLAVEPVDHLDLNDIGRVDLLLSEPIAATRFADDATSGRMVLIDEATNVTAGAAMIVDIRDRL
jgi:bifunctional enzyme CysN/CysC